MKVAPIQLARNLLLLTVVILVAIGLGSLLRFVGNLNRAGLYIFYTLLMFGDAAAMLFCAIQLKKRTKPIFFLTVLVLCLNIFPTIFDQFGLVDFLLLNLITLIFLVIARKDLLPV